MTNYERVSIIFNKDELDRMKEVVTLMNSGRSAYTPTVSRHGLCRTILGQGFTNLLSQLSSTNAGLVPVDIEIGE